MTIEAEVSALTTATTNLLSAVNVSKATLDAKVADATTQADAATANATIASAQNTESGVSASAAAASAASANTAKDLALTAWAAATYPGETLGALSQSLHVGAVVKAIVYDTSKDSDGGAWRKRCADKSWYTETLGGDRWIGQRASVSAAWTAAGSAVGAVYQSSADGKYYTPLSSSTQTEVFRGISREFPAVAGIVAESARVVIYDLSSGAMWMVFVRASSQLPSSGGGAVNMAVAALNGAIFLAAGIANGGMYTFDFLRDSGNVRSDLVYVFKGTISSRLSALGYTTITGSVGFVNGTVNDVAITVLPESEIDHATGLPRPTIAVATAGGVSVILANGTVVNSSLTTNFAKVMFSALNLYYSEGGRLTFRVPIAGLTSGFPHAALYDYANLVNIPVMIGPVGPTSVIGANTFVRGGSISLNLVKENPTTTAKGMVAFITDKYSSGWQVGDSRLATLADSTAETITGSGELVTNGTFDTDVTGWTAFNDTTMAVVGGQLQVTKGTFGVAYQTFATVVGKAYVVSWMATAGTNSPYVTVANAVNGASLIGGNGGVGTYSITFVATATTTYVNLGTNVGTTSGTVLYDNISVKLATPDRSVKNNGLIVNGTLTKAAVAAGAGLVAYSGFSASNYLEQPYNSNLDFGTGDFCVMGWFNRVSTFAGRTIFSRLASGAPSIELVLTNDNAIYYVCSATGVGTATTVTVPLGLSLIALVRESGVVKVYINSVLSYSAANTQNITNTALVSRLGYSTVGASPLGSTDSLALWRISATAPSADQIAHIYRTELPLFQPGAQCTIAGTSAAVTALAYDDVTDLLHVGTSYGRSGFKDLLRVDSEATTTGSITSLSAQGGTVITGGTSAKLYVPAKYLRDELQRKSEARAALGRIPVFFDYDAVTSQVAFVLPKGYTTKAVYSAGLLKRVGSTKDYTVNTDGFVETVTFAVAPGNTVQVSIMAVRSN